MVPRKLLDTVGGDQIGAAVADPGEFEVGTLEMCCDQRGAHAVVHSRVKYCLVGVLNRCLQRIAVLDRLLQRRQCQAACNLPALMPTHAVGDGPEPQLRRAEQCIFIMAAPAPWRALPGVVQQ